MAKFLIQARYVGKGVEGLLKEGGSARRETVGKAVGSYGGKLEAFYYTFGNDDVVAIAEFPDAVAATALSLAINATGTVQLRSTPLISCEEVDMATKKHGTYRPPGG